jgi:hypothetical protein
MCSGSGCLLRSGSVRCGFPLLPGSGRRSGLLRSGSGLALLPGSGRLLCSGSLRCSSALLPRPGHLRLPGSVCRSSVLRSTEVLPGSGDLRLPRSVVSLLPGSGHVLCSGDLCAEVLCPGSGELLRSGRSDVQ